MKVLFLGKFDATGGIERYVRTLATALTTRGGVQVVNLVANNLPRSDAHDNYGYRTERSACWGQWLSVPLAPGLPARARALHRALRFDLVHLNFPDPLGHLAATLLPSVPRVITWHSDIVRQRVALKLYGPWQRRFVAHAQGVIVAAPQMLANSTQIPSFSSPRQVRVVVPFGLDTSQLSWTRAADERARQLRAQAAGRPTIFALGRHVHYKGFDVLLAALRTVPALLWLGGSGPLTAELQVLARSLGIQDRVVFAGRIDEAELPAYYAACDVFALPSVNRAEAFGLVQLEAMWFGKAVVSTRLGTGVEFVNRDGETGLVVPPGDTGALAHALNALLADSNLRKNLGQAARARVAAEFTVTRMVDATFEVYQSILSRARTQDA